MITKIAQKRPHDTGIKRLKFWSAYGTITRFADKRANASDEYRHKVVQIQMFLQHMESIWFSWFQHIFFNLITSGAMITVIESITDGLISLFKGMLYNYNWN